MKPALDIAEHELEWAEKTAESDQRRSLAHARNAIGWVVRHIRAREMEQSSHAAKGERAPGQAARLVAILAVDCPRCGCGVGKQCFVGDGEDESPNSFHRERIDSAPRAKQHGGGRALHPDGKCSCGGEGKCAWCLTHCDDCGSPELVWSTNGKLCASCGAEKSPAPDADGGEEDGARYMYDAIISVSRDDCWEELDEGKRRDYTDAFNYARNVGRKDSAEAIEKAEARLAAWRGMVPALNQLIDTGPTSALGPLIDAVGAVLTAYDQLPAEEQKTGGKGG